MIEKNVEFLPSVIEPFKMAWGKKLFWYLLAWSVGFINFPLLVEEVERRPIVTDVNLLHLWCYDNVRINYSEKY